MLTVEVAAAQAAVSGALSAFRALALITVSVVAIGPTSTLAGERASTGNRPASVPGDYVPTPFGWFHPSCVVALDNDEVLDGGRGVIARRNGQTRTVPPCTRPRYDRHGRFLELEQTSSPAQTPTINGWLGSLQTVTTGGVNWVEARWTVPDAPALGGATVYFFPGIEPLSSPFHIVQPVLGYNHYGSTVWNTWTIASWDCCVLGGNASHSPLISVYPGQAIFGIMTGSNCDAAGVCDTWTITTSPPSGTSTTFTTTGNTQPLNWVFAGVLETYNVSSCTQLPTSNSLTFTSVTVQAMNPLRRLSPQWNPVVDSSATPDCSVTANAQSGAISTATVQWQACAPTWTQPCSGPCGSGRVLCDGTCSAQTPPWFGQSCTPAHCYCIEGGYEGYVGTYDCSGTCQGSASDCRIWCDANAGGG